MAVSMHDFIVVAQYFTLTMCGKKKKLIKEMEMEVEELIAKSG
jgi:hypothetical protein